MQTHTVSLSLHSAQTGSQVTYNYISFIDLLVSCAPPSSSLETGPEEEASQDKRARNTEVGEGYSCQPKVFGCRNIVESTISGHTS